MRHPVEGAVQLAGLEQLIPEQQAEQAAPQRVFGVKNLPAVAAQHGGNAGFRIAAIGVINDKGAAGAQKLRAYTHPPSAEFACMEIAREIQFAVAGGIIDHAA